MKLFEKLEPKLRWLLNDKNARRKKLSCKKLRRRAIRRELNRDFTLGKGVYNKYYGWEF